MPRKRNNIMLAHPAEDRRIKELGQKFIVQPKLKGVHILTGHKTHKTFNGHDFKYPYLMSSTGLEKKYFSTIKEQLATLPDYQFDGELYKHGMLESDINSIASRTVNPHPQEEELEYHIFDIKYPTHQSKRLEILQTKVDFSNLSHIKLVPSYMADQENWPMLLDTFMEQGYEGIMFRALAGEYEDKRSQYLLKLKPTETDIYRIVGFEQGTGWCHDRLGAFVVQDKEGNEFNVGSGSCLTADLRLHYWTIQSTLIDTYLLVKHEKLKTKNNLPQTAIAVKPLSAEEVSNYVAAKHNDLP